MQNQNTDCAAGRRPTAMRALRIMLTLAACASLLGYAHGQAGMFKRLWSYNVLELTLYHVSGSRAEPRRLLIHERGELQYNRYCCSRLVLTDYTKNKFAGRIRPFSA